MFLLFVIASISQRLDYEYEEIEDGTLLVCQNEYRYEYIDDEEVIVVQDAEEEIADEPAPVQGQVDDELDSNSLRSDRKAPIYWP